jgi:hypothetical protein
LLWRGDELGGFSAEGAALLYDGLGDWRYVVVEEEVVGAGGLGERVQGGVVVGYIDGLGNMSSLRR